MFCSLEFPPTYLLGVGFTECLGYCYLKFFPCIVCAPSLVNRGFDVYLSLASISRASTVNLLDVIVNLFGLQLNVSSYWVRNA
jgi:hypothetical protein